MRQSFFDFCIEKKRFDLLMQWDTDANLPLTPKTVTSGSSRNVWWFCEKGHHWQQTPWVRTAHGGGCPVCAGKKIVPGDNDLQTLFPETAEEWHPTKNFDLQPNQVSPYTHRKVWWKCGKCGHEWQAVVKSRAGINKCGCPVCAGKAVLQGYNDLATLYPNIASEWHPTKNGALTPQDVTAGTPRKIWWRCNAGHEWQATISSRTQGCGCPVCTGKTVIPGENDFASRYPVLAKEWDYEKNGSLTPDAVTEQSNRKVWWKCDLGHSYQAVISSRTSDRQGCPYCSGQRVLKGFNDLATVLPKIADQWHPTLNGALTPEEVTCGSAKRVWWKCNVCGYEWKAIIYSRAGAQRCGCPRCAGKVKRSKLLHYERILAEM